MPSWAKKFEGRIPSEPNLNHVYVIPNWLVDLLIEVEEVTKGIQKVLEGRDMLNTNFDVLK